jgi:hypothetical protein
MWTAMFSRAYDRLFFVVLQDLGAQLFENLLVGSTGAARRAGKRWLGEQGGLV